MGHATVDMGDIGEPLADNFIDTFALRCVVDDRGQATDVNPRWLDFTGCAFNEALGRGWLQAVHPSDRDRCDAYVIRAIASGQPLETEFRLRRHDGLYRNMVAFSRAGTRGASRNCSLSSIDISEYKTLEPAIPSTVAAALESLKDLTTATALDHMIQTIMSGLAQNLELRSVGLWLHDATQQMTLMELDFQDGRLQHRVHSESLRSPHLARLQTECLQTPVEFPEVSTDPRLQPMRAYLLEKGIRSLVMVPLMVGSEALGSVLIGTAQPRAFGRNELDSAQAAACKIAVAVKLASWVDRARQAAVLEERHRLAGEIHDSLAQGFTGIVVQLEAAEDALERDPEKVQGHLARARTLARESLAEARRSVDALRFQALEDHDLKETLRQMLDQFTADTGLRTHFVERGTAGFLEGAYEDHLVRICQEALTNAMRYAHATRVHVELNFKAQRVSMRIRDDGVGFDTCHKQSGFGLVGMRLRAKRMNARFTLRSAIGKGTTITVSIPTPDQSVE